MEWDGAALGGVVNGAYDTKNNYSLIFLDILPVKLFGCVESIFATGW